MQNVVFRVTEWGFVMFSGGCWIHKKMNGLQSSIVFSSMTGIQCTLANMLHINKPPKYNSLQVAAIRNSLHFVQLSWVREHQGWGLFVRRNCSPWILSLQCKTCHTLAALRCVTRSQGRATLSAAVIALSACVLLGNSHLWTTFS